MSDPVGAAKATRERMAQALGVLQGEGLPAEVEGVAEAIAETMGLLHAIERSGGAGALETAEVVVERVWRALTTMHELGASDERSVEAIGAVALALPLAHRLNVESRRWAMEEKRRAREEEARRQAEEVARREAEARAAEAAQREAAERAAAEDRRRQMEAARMAAERAVGAFGVPGAADAAPRAAAPAAEPARPALRPETAPRPEAAAPLRIDAELGAHSTTNFYKGLSGNDVVDDGGLFVATYDVPPIGQRVALHVSLPGGYEFDAMGVVKWVREVGLPAPPGFGAQLVQLTPEGRQLVYRYVRNREPIFHDDF